MATFHTSWVASLRRQLDGDIVNATSVESHTASRSQRRCASAAILRHRHTRVASTRLPASRPTLRVRAATATKLFIANASLKLAPPRSGHSQVGRRTKRLLAAMSSSVSEGAYTARGRRSLMFQNRDMTDEWSTFETLQPSDPLVSDNERRSHDRSCAFCLVCELRHCLGFVLLSTCFLCPLHCSRA